jgi:hypothetical protein
MGSNLISRRSNFVPGISILASLLLITGCTGEPGQQRNLSAEFLLGDAPLATPVDTSAYQPASEAEPAHRFEGRLELIISRESGRIKGLIDWFDYLDDPGRELSDLPPFSFDFIQDGNDLIPVSRGPQVSTHPHWEFILEPGKVWDEFHDGDWSRASLPFALQERNANCTHNGLLGFLFRSDGSISRVTYQVGSETCQYLQVDLWGVLDARYTPGNVEGAGSVLAQHSEEVAARLPVRPLQDLALDHPGTDLENFDWFPPDEVSTFGFAIDGVHYSGGCETRYGPYPYCAVLDLPSYSLAKSIFAGMAYMALEQEYPGAGETLLTDYVTECGNTERWRGVSLQHLLDMSTGNYGSLEPHADEFASYETDFIAGETHDTKITASCSLFPRKAEPGSVFAYHSADTYIAGTLMNELLRARLVAGKESPKDVHSDILVERVMRPLGLSPVTWFTRRTYDTRAQPYTGYGLTLHSDDIVRIGLFLARGDGVIEGEQVLDRGQLKAALQREPLDPGMKAGSETLRYNNGFWAYRTSLHDACPNPAWIPFMSGYGGISIAVFPNQSLFYVFSDKGRFEWLKAAIGSNQIRDYCG